MTTNGSCFDILKAFYQKNKLLTKRSCFEILNSNQEYGVFLKTAGDLVFLKCSKNTLVITDDKQQFVKKIQCNFDFNYILVGEMYLDVIYIFDFLCISLTYKQRVHILRELLLPSSCKLHTIHFPTASNTFKIVTVFAQEIEHQRHSTKRQQNEKIAIVFIPCNGITTIHDLFQHPIYEWNFLKTGGISSLLIRYKKVYCKISVEQFNEIHKDNVMFFKTPFFGMVFGAGTDSTVLCPSSLEDGDKPSTIKTCTPSNLCKKCDANEEKVVDCVYTLSGWIPLNICPDKTAALKKGQIFQGPDDWKDVKELTDNFKNQLDLKSLSLL